MCKSSVGADGGSRQGGSREQSPSQPAPPAWPSPSLPVRIPWGSASTHSLSSPPASYPPTFPRSCPGACVSFPEPTVVMGGRGGGEGRSSGRRIEAFCALPPNARCYAAVPRPPTSVCSPSPTAELLQARRSEGIAVTRESSPTSQLTTKHSLVLKQTSASARQKVSLSASSRSSSDWTERWRLI